MQSLSPETGKLQFESMFANADSRSESESFDVKRRMPQGTKSLCARRRAHTEEPTRRRTKAIVKMSLPRQFL